MSDRTRPVLRLNILLAVAVALAAAAVVYMYMERADARVERARVQQARAVYQSDLDALAEQKDLRLQAVAAKEAELGAKQAEAGLGDASTALAGLITRYAANDVSSKIIAFSASNNVALLEFETGQSTLVMSGTEFPAVSYSLVATGTAEGLTGILDIAAQVPTALVEKLELTAATGGGWTLDLVLKVAYREQS